MKTGAFLHLDLSLDMEQALAGLSRLDGRVQKAVNRAVRKLIKWLKRRLMQLLSKSSGIAQKAFKGRIRDSYNVRDGWGYLWVGLNPVPAHLAGKPVQNAAGTRVRGRTFKSAFVADVYGDGAKVWRRKFRGKGSAARTNLNQRGNGGFFEESQAGGLGRFPVELMVFEVEKLGREVVGRLQESAKARFAKLVEQELNYVLLHEV